MEITLTSIENGAIRFYGDDDQVIGFGNSAFYLADLIRRFGGGRPGWKMMSSSLFIEALNGCDDAAEEGGFNNAKEVADLWKEVCDYV